MNKKKMFVIVTTLCLFVSAVFASSVEPIDLPYSYFSIIIGVFEILGIIIPTLIILIGLYKYFKSIKEIKINMETNDEDIEIIKTKKKKCIYRLIGYIFAAIIIYIVVRFLLCNLTILHTRDSFFPEFYFREESML